MNERADALKATLVFLTPAEVKVRVLHRSIEGYFGCCLRLCEGLRVASFQNDKLRPALVPWAQAFLEVMISEDERPQFQGVEAEVMEERVACVQSTDRKLQLRGLSGLRHLVCIE